MFDNLHAYFYENVLDTFNNYLKVKKSFKAGKSNDLRAALNLATILYHFREQIPIDIRKTRKCLSSLCPDYDLLGDIVNVSKHGKLTINKPKISTASNISEQIIITEYKDKDGDYNHIEKSVRVRLDNGSERDLHEIIINVLNMWIKELNELGVLTKIEPLKILDNKIPKRSKNSGILNLESFRNVRFTQQFKLQRYNYENGTIEPIDLSGSKVEMNIYKPSFTLCLNVVDNNTGKEQKIEITIDEKQKRRFSRLKTENEKLVYFLKLAKDQGKISNYSFNKQS